VELFVQQNADLQAELNMLQQTISDADAVVFDSKASLFKEEFTALQENLLLYVDGELSATDKLNTEKLLQADTAAGKELALLQQTKLQPDTALIFANKKVLYRKERARVIDFPWRRIAVAAILLGFGTWATIAFINTDKTGTGKFATNTPAKTNSTKQVENGATQGVQQQQAAVAGSNDVTASTKDVVKPTTQKNNLPVVANKAQQNTTEQKGDNTTTVQNDNKKGSNNLPKPYFENINKDERNKDAVAIVTPVNPATEIRPAVKIPVVETKSDLAKEVVVNGYALNANFTESDDANTVSPDNNKGKKSKLGGLIRKVKRLVDRNTNTTNGNSVQIAGFDIAIK
jgi:hypothetical protein